jgi:hypothetical protein
MSINSKNNGLALFWQISLMAGLGLPGLFFMPILLHKVDHQIMASVLIAQVYVYYGVILINFGLDWSSPAEYGQAANENEANEVWVKTVQSKISILFFIACPVFIGGIIFLKLVDFYLIVLPLVLVASALNSNWLLNARHDYRSGVLYVYAGVLISSILLCFAVDIGEHSFYLGFLVVLIMTLPQLTLGTGTWFSVRKIINPKIFLKINKKYFDFSVIKKNYLLVATQLMQLMSATLGTIVVGAMSDTVTSTAYGALEKVFNLAVSVLVALYMTKYPLYASLFTINRRLYWRGVGGVLFAYFAIGITVALILTFFGQRIGSVYLTVVLSDKVALAYFPFAIWLGLCACQNVLTGYYIFSKKPQMVFWVNLSILLVTCAVGYSFAMALQPVMWVLGLISGQLLALAWLSYLFFDEKNRG